MNSFTIDKYTYKPVIYFSYSSCYYYNEYLQVRTYCFFLVNIGGI